MFAASAFQGPGTSFLCSLLVSDILTDIQANFNCTVSSPHIKAESSCLLPGLSVYFPAAAESLPNVFEQTFQGEFCRRSLED